MVELLEKICKHHKEVKYPLLYMLEVAEPFLLADDIAATPVHKRSFKATAICNAELG